MSQATACCDVKAQYVSLWCRKPQFNGASDAGSRMCGMNRGKMFLLSALCNTLPQVASGHGIAQNHTTGIDDLGIYQAQSAFGLGRGE